MSRNAALSEALAQVESTYRCVEWTPAPVPGAANGIAPTGERYIVLSNDGVVAEATSRDETGDADPEVAVRRWLAHLHAYAEAVDPQGKGVLYWRVKPELERQDYSLNVVTLEKTHFASPRYHVYSRLLISDKPVIEARGEAA